MKSYKAWVIVCAVLFVVGAASMSWAATAATKAAKKAAAVEQGPVAAATATTTDGRPSKLIDGNLWTKMTGGEKIAYVQGVGEVVEIERSLAQKEPSLQDEDFSAKAVQGLSGVPISDIVATVDKFYAANADKLDENVMRVIWDTMIRPKIKTGIAGRPLTQ